MDVGFIRSQCTCHCISRDWGSDSQFLSVLPRRTLLRRSANAGDLRTFYEDSHFEQLVMRPGHLAVSKASAIATVAAASFRGPDFWSGSSDSLSCWAHRGNPVPLFVV